jgi:succinate dehydrogenase flavin-adding protein (antitoxin of CptAB toxin-antitoxin module)
MRLLFRLFFSIAIILAYTALTCGQVGAEEAPADYFHIQQELNTLLFQQDKEFYKLVQETQKKPSDNAKTVTLKIALFMRAGMSKAVTAAIQDLKQLAPDLDNHSISQIYYAACDQYANWKVAKAVVDTFAENISELELRNRLIKYFQAQRWSVGQIDQWLADKPAGRDNFWLKTRLRFNKEYHQEQPIIRTLTEAVKKNPQDIDRVQTYLEMLIMLKSGDYQEWNLEWMTEIIKPQRATESLAIAQKLFRLANYKAARPFFAEALRIPLTEADFNDRALQSQALRTRDQIETAFKINTLEATAKCLAKLRDVTAAQKLMLKANQLRDEHDIPMNALLAGEIQAQSGQRVIEKKIEEKEVREKDDPRYWHERALYYRGRNESYKESQAIKKGFALTTPQPPPERITKGHTDWRSILLSDYIHYLKRQNQDAEAVQLLLTEVAESPAHAMSTKQAVHTLSFDYPKHIDIDDEHLWTWLSQRAQWEYTEERLLWEMLKKAPAPKLLDYLIKAEQMAKGQDPTRAYVLGWIENRINQPVRSIALLKEAMAKSEDDELKRKATFTLFESYLAIKDWIHAERLFPEAAQHLTPQEWTDWYGRIAVAAAQSAEFTEAIRLWENLANLNPAATQHLDAMLKAGLKEELIAFYKIMVFRLPESSIPKKALLILKSYKEP